MTAPEFGSIDHDAAYDRLILAGAEDRLTAGAVNGWHHTSRVPRTPDPA
jgi:hypothetical protein